MTTLDKLLLEYCHPVGSLYWSKDSADPGTLFGGTWERIKDKFILAAGDAHASGEIGGEESHTLTENELPKISGSAALHGAENGSFIAGNSGAFKNGTVNANIFKTYGDSSKHTGANSYRSLDLQFGGNQSHNNMPPYLALYCWIRTA